MSLTLGEILGYIVQYGLPSVALLFVAWASWTGAIVWKPTIDAYKDQIRDAQADAARERLEREMYRNELLKTKRTTEKSVGMNERLVETVAKQ